MIEFFQEGGWGMWAILFVGLVLLVDSGRFAYKPELRRLGFLAMLGLSTIFSMIYSTLLDVATVFTALATDSRIPEKDFVKVLLMGMKESTRPGVFGAVILTVASLLVAVGMLRRSRAEEA
jgi:hypothetical protein